MLYAFTRQEFTQLQLSTYERHMPLAKPLVYICDTENNKSYDLYGLYNDTMDTGLQMSTDLMLFYFPKKYLVDEGITITDQDRLQIITPLGNTKTYKIRNIVKDAEFNVKNASGVLEKDFLGLYIHAQELLL